MAKLGVFFSFFYIENARPWNYSVPGSILDLLPNAEEEKNNLDNAGIEPTSL